MCKKTEAKLKTCTKCGEAKSEERFRRNSASKDGRRSQCKACENSASFKKDPNKILDRMTRVYR